MLEITGLNLPETAQNEHIPAEPVKITGPNRPQIGLYDEHHDRFEACDRLARTLRDLLVYDKQADEVAQCHRVFREYGPECGDSRHIAIPFSCWHRLCPFCNAHRTRRAIDKLYSIMEVIQAPKLITLTVRNVREISPRYLQEVRAWFTKLRALAKWKKAVRGGVYSLEVTYNSTAHTWHVHLHALVDADYLPQAWLSQAWEKANMGAGYVVDIRPAKRDKTTLKEVVKYIAKGSKLLDDRRKVGDLLYAIKGARLLGTFGCFYAFDYSELERPEGDKELYVRKKFPTCRCGSTDVEHWKRLGDVTLDRVRVCLDLITGEKFLTVTDDP